MQSTLKLDDISFLKIAVVLCGIGVLVAASTVVVSAIQEGQTEGKEIVVLDKMTALEADPDNPYAAVTVYYAIGTDGTEYRLRGPGPYTMIQPGERYHINYTTKDVDDKTVLSIESFRGVSAAPTPA